MINLQTIDIMNYDVFVDDINKINLNVKEKTIINTINAHSYITAKNDALFQEALKSADVLIPDGSGVVLAAKLLKSMRIRKIAGPDMHKHLLELLNESSGTCFYMGAGQQTLDNIQNRLKEEYPNIKAEFYSPPYRDEFLPNETEDIIEAINQFKPDVLFVGLTAPKQEKWVQANSEQIDAKIFCSIGAVFDFYSGAVTRPSNFWISIHMEWLPRFLKEPIRLWRRTLISMPLFLIDMFLFKFKIKK